MAKNILIIGKSGSGKTTSLRNLNDKDYALINPLGKELPFKSNKPYLETFSYEQIKSALLTYTNKGVKNIFIDDAGYLNRSIHSIVDDFLFRHNLEVKIEEIEDVLSEIQSLDPIGIGARDLQESLKIQLNRKQQKKSILFAKLIVETYFDFFKKKQYNIIIQRTDCSDEDLQDAIDEIVKLNPKPGNSLLSDASEAISIIPDFMVFQQNSKVDFQVNNYSKRKLRTSKYYEGLLKTVSESDKPSDKKTISFLKERLDSANVFIDALNRRNDTLYLIMDAIINYQYEYFIEGDIQKLRPMQIGRAYV